MSEEFIAFVEPLSVSSGRWASVRLQEEPPSLCTKREGDQEFPWLFVRPSDLPAGLGHDLGLPKYLLAWALAMYGLAHSHP